MVKMYFADSHRELLETLNEYFVTRHFVRRKMSNHEWEGAYFSENNRRNPFQAKIIQLCNKKENFPFLT